MAIVRAKHQELDKDPRLQDPSDDFYGKFEEFAMFKCTYYQCYKCKKPYFGGLADCGQGEDRPVDEKELICPQCSAASVGAGITNCAIHGTDYIDFKLGTVKFIIFRALERNTGLIYEPCLECLVREDKFS